MDPVTAFGIAAGVVQFVGFTSNLLRAGKDIYQQGSPRELRDVDTVTDDLARLLKGLQIATPDTERPDLDETEKGIAHLASECAIVANRLLATLQKVERRPGASRRVTFLRAFKYLTEKTDIEAMLVGLDRFQQQITLHLMNLLRNEARSTFEAAAAQLEETKRDIITQFLEGRLEFQASVDYNFSKLLNGQNAILKAVNGKRGRDAEAISDEITQQRVLECLNFRQATTRIIAVPEAHEKTFQWTFRQSRREWQRRSQIKHEWDSLTDWLTTGSGCYWISGKMGSGKSTLMKYILQNPETRKLLSKWANGKDVFIPAFFFWSEGTPLQKSEAGLLRAILKDIIEKLPSLAQLLLPDIFASMKSRNPDHSEPSLPELRAALKRLSLVEEDLRLCLLIDGIDEYEGDQGSLAELLGAISTSPSIKVLLSSREEAACVAHFSVYPKLRMQDLTEYDIRSYVIEKLRQPDFVDVMAFEKGSYDFLLEQIIYKASGVFLWVALVVKSLQQGLVAGDRYFDLERRLEDLPPELIDLYRVILSRIPKAYLEDASRMLKLKQAHSKTRDEGHMTIIDMQVAMEEVESPLSTFPLKCIEYSDVQQRCEPFMRRLRSRCCGLLEIISTQDYPIHSSHSYQNMYVEYTHKSVPEFLRSQSNDERCISLYQASDTLSEIALARSKLRLIQSRLVDGGGNYPRLDRYLHILQFYCLLSGLDMKHTDCVLGLVDEYCRLVDSNYMPLIFDFGYATAQAFQFTNSALGQSALFFAAVNGLTACLNKKLSNPGTILDGDVMQKGLMNTLMKLRDTDEDICSPDLRVIEVLLEHGSDVNKLTEDYAYTPWTHILRLFPLFPKHQQEMISPWPFVRLMLLHGADLNVKFCPSGEGPPTVRAIDFLEELFLPFGSLQWKRELQSCKDIESWLSIIRAAISAVIKDPTLASIRHVLMTDEQVQLVGAILAYDFENDELDDEFEDGSEDRPEEK